MKQEVVHGLAKLAGVNIAEVHDILAERAIGRFTAIEHLRLAAAQLKHRAIVSSALGRGR